MKNIKNTKAPELSSGSIQERSEQKARLDICARMAMPHIIIAAPQASPEQVAREAWAVATQMERIRREVFANANRARKGTK